MAGDDLRFVMLVDALEILTAFVARQHFASHRNVPHWQFCHALLDGRQTSGVNGR